MLIDIETGKEISTIPHKTDFDSFLKKISTSDYQKIVDKLNSVIDTDKLKGSEIQTAGWIPGNDWSGTVYEPIENIFHNNKDASGKIFGITVWKVFMDREDKWGFGRYSVKDTPIESMTYFGVTV
ncbi:MAG: hypothetical protein Ta2A_18390 [Treponemataceae bacterium]|nr:MAG: hypothetical protein Ta2A_18390 [Treponemataceae bacterium]